MNLPEFSMVDPLAKMAILRFSDKGHNEYMKALTVECGKTIHIDAVTLKTNPRRVYEVLVTVKDDALFKAAMTKLRA